MVKLRPSLRSFVWECSRFHLYAWRFGIFFIDLGFALKDVREAFAYLFYAIRRFPHRVRNTCSAVPGEYWKHWSNGQ